ncbi:unnamed protein product [Ectocarpus sp. 6 AP-2014]
MSYFRRGTAKQLSACSNQSRHVLSSVPLCLVHVRTVSVGLFDITEQPKKVPACYSNQAVSHVFLFPLPFGVRQHERWLLGRLGIKPFFALFFLSFSMYVLILVRNISDGFFDVTEQPKKVAVVGAGYIAVELAGIFDALGTETHLFIRRERAMRTLDPLLSDILDLEMARAGPAVHKNSTTEKITKDEATGKLTLHTKDGQALGDLDVVLMAIGKKTRESPNVGSLGLPSAGVEQSERGHITVDEWQNTSAEGVYALGDVTGRVELTPMAIAAGRKLSDRLFAGMKDAKADYTNVPTVVFSHPPMATCGLTEPDARAEYGEDAVKVYQSKFTNLFFGHWQMPPEDKEKTAMKVIVTGESEKVVGIHIIGMGADEMMQGFGVAMKMGCTKADLDSCVAIHPTASEELVTLAPWGLENGKRSGV